MEKLTLDNYIGGKDLLFSGQRFEVNSPFYSDCNTLLPNSSLFEIKSAIFNATKAVSDCRKLDFDDREKILSDASKKLKFNSMSLEYTVKMTGMPIHYVKYKLDDIISELSAVPKLIRMRLGMSSSRLNNFVAKGTDLYAVLNPVDGFIYAVTPGNDPRTVPFVAAWSVALGIPAIIKPSKNDFLISKQVVKAIVDSGYPAGGLNIIGWDTSQDESSKKNFALVDSASVVWAFGDDKTVDNVLRFEVNENKNIIDHFSGKIILRHASGRGAGVYEMTDDLKKNANIIVESAYEWPISCNSLKALFVTSTNYDELISNVREITQKNFSNYVGDPMQPKTRVGYVSTSLLKYVNSRFESLNSLNLIKQVLPYKQISPNQTTPMLFELDNINSEFFSREYSLYLLSIKKSESFENAVKDVNESSGPQKRIAVSVISDDEEKVLGTYFHAHHVKRLRHSTELDVLYHEGNDYLYRLMIPQIHRVTQKFK